MRARADGSHLSAGYLVRQCPTQGRGADHRRYDYWGPRARGPIDPRRTAQCEEVIVRVADERIRPAVAPLAVARTNSIFLASGPACCVYSWVRPAPPSVGVFAAARLCPHQRLEPRSAPWLCATRGTRWRPPLRSSLKQSLSSPTQPIGGCGLMGNVASKIALGIAVVKRIRRYAILAFAATGLAATTSVVAAEPTGDQKPAATVSYFRDIRPIFQVHCLGCHQPAKAMGDFVMTNFERLLKGGESEQAAIVPGKPDESNLLSQITPTDGKAEMPKDKEPLDRRSDQAHSPVDRRRGPGRHADVGPQRDRHGASARLRSGAGADGARLFARRHAAWPSAAITRRCCTRPTARAWSPGWSASRSGSSRSPSRPTARSLAVTGGSPGRLGEVQVWDVESRKLKYSLPVTYDTVYGASWSADGTKIAFGCADNTCERSTPPPASRCSTRAPTATGCSTPCSPRKART